MARWIGSGRGGQLQPERDSAAGPEVAAAPELVDHTWLYTVPDKKAGRPQRLSPDPDNEGQSREPPPGWYDAADGLSQMLPERW